MEEEVTTEAVSGAIEEISEVKEAEEVTEEETETKEILRTENFVKATEAWTAEVIVKTVVANVMVIVVNFVAVINSKMASKKTKATKKIFTW